MRIGLESRQDLDQLKNLKENTILYSCEYNDGSGTVDPCVYLFKGYVKAPNNKSQNGIWAKIATAEKDEKGNYVPMLTSTTVKVPGQEEEKENFKEDIHVTDISVGLWFNPKDAFIAFRAKMQEIVDACDKAIENA